MSRTSDLITDEQCSKQKKYSTSGTTSKGISLTRECIETVQPTAVQTCRYEEGLSKNNVLSPDNMNDVLTVTCSKMNTNMLNYNSNFRKISAPLVPIVNQKLLRSHSFSFMRS